MAKAEVATTAKTGFMESVKGIPQSIAGFYNEVRTEMKKVTSPSRKEVQATTTVVIITVFIFGVFFFVVDGVIGNSLDYIFRHLGK